MSYIHITKEIVPTNGRIVITGETAHYIRDVLRIRLSERVTLFNGEGSYYEGKIIEVRRDGVVAEVEGIQPPDMESNIDITLYQGLLKGDKMEYVIQKATELGVKMIVPVVAARSVPAFSRRMERWGRVAADGARQCGRIYIPKIETPVGFGEAIKGTSSDALNLIFYEAMESDSDQTLSDVRPASDRFNLFIGPEGGFSIDEASIARDRGFHFISLGKRILRAGTAAVSAITLIQYLFGDLS